MAQQTDITLKTYFETGDVPTEAQYIDLIDSKRNVQDEIPQADVANLAPLTATVSTSGSIAIPAGALIEYIVLLPSSGGAYTIGTTPGGTEYESGTLTGTTPYTYVTSGEYTIAGKTIYFTGTFDAKIYIR
jgi:hypothetical protein